MKIQKAEKSDFNQYDFSNSQQICDLQKFLQSPKTESTSNAQYKIK